MKRKKRRRERLFLLYKGRKKGSGMLAFLIEDYLTVAEVLGAVVALHVFEREVLEVSLDDILEAFPERQGAAFLVHGAEVLRGGEAVYGGQVALGGFQDFVHGVFICRLSEVIAASLAANAHNEP